MKILTVNLGQAIDDGNYPPRLVLADYYQGTATILRADNPEEDIDTLYRQVHHVQKANATRRRKNA